MMIFLEAILLILGLIISLITLVKKDIEKNKKTKKALAALYILVCVISVGLLVFKFLNQKESDLRLFDTLGKIENSVNIQSDTLLVVLERTRELSNKLDSINDKTEEAINQREQSQRIFSAQNKLLKKANELTEKNIKDESPYIEVLSHDIHFIPKDKISTELTLIFTNLRKRPALRFENEIFIVFRNKEGTDWGDYYIHRDSNIKSVFIDHPIISLGNNIEIKLPDLLKVAGGSLLQITVKFYDAILEEYFCYNLIYIMKVEDDKIIAYMSGKDYEKEIQSFRRLINKPETLTKLKPSP